MRNKIIGDFVKTEKRAPTQQELTSAVFEMYRRERLHKNLSGAIVEEGFMYLHEAEGFTPTVYDEQDNTFITYNPE
mgnify:CR=1 FL=1